MHIRRSRSGRRRASIETHPVEGAIARSDPVEARWCAASIDQLLEAGIVDIILPTQFDAQNLYHRKERNAEHEESNT